MQRLTTIPPLVLVLVLGGLSVPCEAQLRQPSDVQPAQRPEREFQRELQKGGPSLQGPIGGKLPSQSGPGTSELPTNTGINMGKPFAPGFDPAAKIPGAGGADRNQPIGQTSPALPTSTDPLANRPKHDGKGTKVGPGYFTKEQQLIDLTDPKAGMKDLGAGMKDAGLGSPTGKNPLTKSPADLLGGIQTTVTPGEGKNVSGKREQQSEDSESPAPTPYPSSTSTPRMGTIVPSLGPTEPAQAKVPLTHGDEAGTTTGVASPNASGPATTPTSRDVRIRSEGASVITVVPKAEPGTAASPSKVNILGRPNPETDTGDGHVPKGIISGKQPKSPSEIEAERKRQVTLPGEGQSQPARVYVSPEDALKEGIRRSTDGRIDPADPTAATPTGSASTTRRPGFGPERVDGRPGFAIGGAPPHLGNTPDNPTASQGPTTSQVPSTSTDKNAGGTTGDASNRP